MLDTTSVVLRVLLEMPIPTRPSSVLGSIVEMSATGAARPVVECERMTGVAEAIVYIFWLAKREHQHSVVGVSKATLYVIFESVHLILSSVMRWTVLKTRRRWPTQLTKHCSVRDGSSYTSIFQTVLSFCHRTNNCSFPPKQSLPFCLWQYLQSRIL